MLLFFSFLGGDRCHKCSELLVDLMYYYSPETDEVYCGKHHAETIVPRCQGCEEVRRSYVHLTNV